MHTLSELLLLSQAPEGRQKLRVMLAELVGWKRDETQPPGTEGNFPWNIGGDLRYDDWDLPNYTEDLNACAQVALSLHKADCIKSVNNRSREYLCHLLDICNPSVSFEKWTWGTSAFAADATAVQRTIALILALQKPEPSPVVQLLKKLPD